VKNAVSEHGSAGPRIRPLRGVGQPQSPGRRRPARIRAAGAVGMLALVTCFAALPAHRLTQAQQASVGERRTVRGVVLGPEGKPVAGARLYVGHDGRTGDVMSLIPDYGKHEKPRSGGTSGAGGRFELVAEEEEIIAAAADGFGPDWARAGDARNGELVLRLVKDDVPLTGRVLDAQGQPVAGATVHLILLSALPEEDLARFLKVCKTSPHNAVDVPTKRLHRLPVAGLPATVTADRDGRFRLTGLGRERLVRFIISGDGIASQGCWAFTREGVDVDRFPQPSSRPTRGPVGDYAYYIYGAKFEHQGVPTRVVEGTVREAGSGRPIAGAIVKAKAGWVTGVATDGEGRYRLTGLPAAGLFRLGAFPGKSGGDDLWIEKEAGGAAGPVTVDLEVTKGVRVQGRLLDQATGAPVRGAVKYQALGSDARSWTGGGRSPTYWSQPVSTDRDGRFSLVVAPGPGMLLAQADRAVREENFVPAARCLYHSAEATPPGERFHACEPINAPATGGPLTRDLELYRGRNLPGVVMDPEGKPLPSARVVGLTPWPGEMEALNGAEFSVRALDPRRPRLIAFVHRERRLAGYVVVRAGDQGPLRVTLQPWGTVTGRVVTDGTRTPADLELAFSQGDREDRSFTLSILHPSRPTISTDAEGRFRFEGLVPGLSVRLATVRGPGRLPVIDLQDGPAVRPGATTDLGDVPLAKPPG
jgi:Carboxypeptidase regulatory-like domain